MVKVEIWNTEGYNMFHADRYVASLLLAAALAAPISIMAAPTPEEHSVQVRINDRRHKDYHAWDDHENHAWGAYQTSNHRRHYEYARAHRREQDRYWNWRHSHPDRD